MPVFLDLGWIALWVAVLTAVASGADYYRRFNHVLTGREVAAAAMAQESARRAAATRSPVNRDQVSNVHRVH